MHLTKYGIVAAILVRETVKCELEFLIFQAFSKYLSTCLQVLPVLPFLSSRILLCIIEKMIEHLHWNAIYYNTWFAMEFNPATKKC